ncbi:DMT family transporter [Konateibacter massiliensis]|uniref:DMT family transporter n=1 Tax=Konateibacter massiliensis TaxID=2002841 RepID=UPI0015D495EE|nr:DMT family transporter [Konateibacter massiliensis]
MAVFLSILSGVLLSVMIAMNSELSSSMGVYYSVALIHLIGLVIIIAIMKVKKLSMKFQKNIPLIWYSGGAVGILTTVFQNVTVSTLGVSKTLALALFGQSVISIVIEHYGLFETPKKRIRKKQFIGIGLILSGITVMFLY